MYNNQSNSGLFIIDKPDNMTSAQVVAFVKKRIKAKKVGHSGTLDFFAKGVLLCCVNRATKLASFLLKGDKKYNAVMQLGLQTDTQDFTGNIVSQNTEIKILESDIYEVFKTFEGSYEQLPPVYSALKSNGVALYKLARQGKAVQKPARMVSIFSINIIKINIPFIHFSVHCSSGTYIRTLCSDIGNKLCCGAVLNDLTRTYSSGFSINDAISLKTFESYCNNGEIYDHLIKMPDILKNKPELTADNALFDKIKYGLKITKQDLPLAFNTGILKIISKNNSLLAVISCDKADSELDILRFQI